MAVSTICITHTHTHTHTQDTARNIAKLYHKPAIYQAFPFTLFHTIIALCKGMPALLNSVNVWHLGINVCSKGGNCSLRGIHVPFLGITLLLLGNILSFPGVTISFLAVALLFLEIIAQFPLFNKVFQKQTFLYYSTNLLIPFNYARLHSTK